MGRESPGGGEERAVGALVQVLHGDDAHLRVELLRRFRGESAVSATRTPRRTVGELLEAAETRRTERERLAVARREQERARRERQAAIVREQRLESLGGEEEHVWQRVSMLIDTKSPGEYDAAVELLVDLRAVDERKGRPEVFEQRFSQLRRQHLRKPSLLKHLDRAGLAATARPADTQ